MGTLLEADRLRDDADRNGAARVRRTATPRSRKTHPTTDGEMEGGAEGEAQGPVHPWHRPGTEHTQRHREEVHECRKPTHVAVARPRNVGSALVC